MVIILSVPHITTPFHVECDFYSGIWDVLGTIYYCSVRNEVSIASLDESILTSVSGLHSRNKSDHDVVGFYIFNKTVSYFPKGLGEIFQNLNSIWIYNCHYKNISQSDVAVYSNLIYLYLGHNDIEVLEQGIFDYNPKLKAVFLHYNKISQIDSNIFDNLSQLVTLDIRSNACINMSAENDIKEVQKIIQNVKNKCQNLDSTYPVTSKCQSSEKNLYAVLIMAILSSFI